MMTDFTLPLQPREQRIADLLLQGYDNAEIGKELNIAPRTVKAYFNRLFTRFNIESGIKRVKLATLLYRRQLWLEKTCTENALLMNENGESSNWWPEDSRTARLPLPSAPPNTLSRTTYA
jgi:hypothetical protein